MKKFLYSLWDIFLAFLLMMFNMLGCFLLGITPFLIGFYTSWHWVSLLSFISGPVALILMIEFTDKIDGWYYKRGTIGKEIERGI